MNLTAVLAACEHTTVLSHITVIQQLVTATSTAACGVLFMSCTDKCTKRLYRFHTISIWVIQLQNVFQCVQRRPPGWRWQTYFKDRQVLIKCYNAAELLLQTRNLELFDNTTSHMPVLQFIGQFPSHTPFFLSVPSERGSCPQPGPDCQQCHRPSPLGVSHRWAWGRKCKKKKAVYFKTRTAGRSWNKQALVNTKMLSESDVNNTGCIEWKRAGHEGRRQTKAKHTQWWLTLSSSELTPRQQQ